MAALFEDDFSKYSASGSLYILFYQPPCGNWYVHSHKLYPSVEAGKIAATKFLAPGTDTAILPVNMQMLEAFKFEVP